jgi:hypothetical protein
MRGLGLMLLIIGGGSFILPMMGRQFILVSVFGEYEKPAAIGMIVLGAILTLVSLKGKKEKKA